MTESRKTSRTLTQGMKVQTWPELTHTDGDSATVVAEQGLPVGGAAAVVAVAESPT